MVTSQYLLDSNVLSEIRKGKKAHPFVQAWFENRKQTELATSVICLMEVKVGIHRALKQDTAFGLLLQEWYEKKIRPAFQSTALSFDLQCAETCAHLQSKRTLPFRDGMIAATALENNSTLVTRNVTDFEGLGLEVVNPWDKNP